MAYLIMYKIIFTLLLCCCATAYGAEVDNALLKKNLEAANLQIEVLKAQVEVMKSYQDKFLSTVYWSLGTVAALVVFLAGFNWFTNNRNAEKEAALHKEMITNELNSIKNDIGQQFLNLKQDFQNELTQELESMRGMQNESNSVIKNELESRISTKFNSQIIGLKNEQKAMKRDLLVIKYDNWLKKDIPSNAFRVAVDLLALSENDYAHRIGDAFDKINKALKIAKDKNCLGLIDASDRANLIKTMKPYSENYKIVIDDINSLLIGG